MTLWWALGQNTSRIQHKEVKPCLIYVCFSGRPFSEEDSRVQLLSERALQEAHDAKELADDYEALKHFANEDNDDNDNDIDGYVSSRPDHGVGGSNASAPIGGSNASGSPRASLPDPSHRQSNDNSQFGDAAALVKLNDKIAESEAEIVELRRDAVDMVSQRIELVRSHMGNMLPNPTYGGNCTVRFLPLK